MPFKLGPRSLLNLRGVHPDLIRVVKRAISISSVDFTVIEGLRSVARQKELVAKGASKTMRSRHISGHAIDIAPYVAGQVRWDWPLFLPIAQAMKQAAEIEDVKIRWGGTWRLLQDTPQINMGVLHKKFPDGPHYELPEAFYS
jgi:peptidoglycan L-alanyl-D-glutamate endopeptidase CwlK